MQAPPVWTQIGKRIHQDFLLEHPDLFSGFAHLARSLGSDEKHGLVQYLRFLSSSELPGGEHKRRWDELGTDFSIRLEGTQAWQDFYESILAAVEKGSTR